MIIRSDRVILVNNVLTADQSQVSVSWQIQNVPIVVNPASKKLHRHRVRNNRGRMRRGITWPTVIPAAMSTGYSPSMYLAAAGSTSSSKVENDFGHGLRPFPKSSVFLAMPTDADAHCISPIQPAAVPSLICSSSTRVRRSLLFLR